MPQDDPGDVALDPLDPPSPIGQPVSSNVECSAGDVQHTDIDARLCEQIVHEHGRTGSGVDDPRRPARGKALYQLERLLGVRLIPQLTASADWLLETDSQ